MAKTATPKKSDAGTVRKPVVKTVGQKKSPAPARRKTTGSMVTAGTMTSAKVKKGKPALKASPKKNSKSSSKNLSASLTRYRCKLCGYIYSPLRGEPHHGIPPGTPFDDLPEDYVCPVCGADGKGRIGKWGFEEWHATRYICSVCGYVYDEKRGEPHRGIKAGTKFENLPDDYVCPVCALDPKIKVQFGKVFKQGFEPLNIS